MTANVTTFISTFAGILAPFRRALAPRVLKQPTTQAAPATPPVMDAATYAAMIAEAERIAAPYREHIAALQQPEGDFPEVEALLARAGLIER